MHKIVTQQRQLKRFYSIIFLVTMICYPLYAQSSLLDIQIETVESVTINTHQLAADDAMFQACQTWQLNKQQVKLFFELSENYSDNPYTLYYQMPCSIKGTLKYQNKIWRFTIDGGAIGKWQYQTTTRYFGCNVAACESLVLLPSDGMVSTN